MVNVTPRRKPLPKPVARKKTKQDDSPWKKGDPTRKYGLNTPIAEPLMMMLDYLVEQRIIYSKASFIREVVSRAAEQEISRARRMRDATKHIK